MTFMLWFYIAAIAIGAVSLVTFILYCVDKYKASHGLWRIPEKVLLLFSFFGGALGGLLGMHLVRHKTRHWYFHVVNILGAIWQVGLLGYLLAVELLI